MQSLFYIHTMMIKKYFIALLLFTLSFPSIAKEPNISTEEYLKNIFNNKPPMAKSFWLNKTNKPIVEKILKHKSPLRYRYWHKDNKTVWIMNEIGKERPITIGVVISDQTIQQVDIIAFRESRGWEVQHSFFTDQFKQVTLQQKKSKYKLSTHIDGITGATLSVRAVKKVTTLALYLQQLASENNAS